MSIDINYIRDQFPALKRTCNGFPVAYLDGPGGTQVPQRVIDAVTHYLIHHNANIRIIFFVPLINSSDLIWVFYNTQEELDRTLAALRSF